MPLRESTVVTGAGRYHRVAIRTLDGVETRLTAEGCNLDDAEDVEEIPNLPQDVSSEALCKRCFRPPELVEA